MRVKVLYIAGWGRSGSTVLGNILGQIKGFFHAGELFFLWDRGLIENRLCSCRTPFKQCSVWAAILANAFESINDLNVNKLVQVRDIGVRSYSLPLRLIPKNSLILRRYLGDFLFALEKLYHSIRITTNSEIIVDSSKFPSYGHTLEMINELDLYIVHLVRDPRAVAYSWLRKKHFEPSRNIHMIRFNPLQSSLRWVLQNAAAEAIWRRRKSKYMLVRYEDFINDPEKVVAHIVNFVGGEMSSSPFTTKRTVEIKDQHVISGNPVRFTKGFLELKADEEWMVTMKKTDKVIVTTLTWPFLLRYGYIRRGKK